MRARTLGIAVAAVLALAAPAAAQAPEAPPPPDPAAPPQIDVAAAILVDLDSGEVLYEREPRAIRASASLTKVVTALVARERYGLDEVVTATDLAASETGSRLGLETGYSLTVRDLLYAVLLKSGNDAATALADHHPGGHDAFIELMNERARALGAYDSGFANAHGLDAEGHHSTAWDMAIFARRLLADPLLADIVRTESYEVPWPDGTPRTFTNHNKLVGTYPDAIGVKTGFTNNAGHSLISAVDAPEGRFLAVVLGARDHYAASRALFDHAKALAVAPPPEPEAQGGGAGDGASVLSTPPPAPHPPSDGAIVASASLDGDESFLWAALMALLAAGMLLTMIRARHPHPLREAAQFHPFLEPLCAPEDRTDGPGMRGPSRNRGGPARRRSAARKPTRTT